MERKERKRFTRKQLTISNRHNKLISQYVSFKHPDIYKDAEAFYKMLNHKYPEKRDLCKTIEYLELTTGAITYHQYYSHRKQDKRARDKRETASETTTTGQHVDSMASETTTTGQHVDSMASETTTTGQHVDSMASETTTTGQHVDSMVLQIPLLSSQSVANNMSLDIPQYEDVMTEINNDSDLRAVFNNCTTTMDTSASESNTSASESNTMQSFLGVIEQDLQDFVEELVNDPQLNQVFDDMETTLENELLDMGL